MAWLHLNSSLTNVMIPTSVLRLVIEFHGQYFNQINGVATGTKMMFLGYLEHKIMNTYDDPIPGLYKMYIDDVLVVINLSEKETIKFLELEFFVVATFTLLLLSHTHTYRIHTFLGSLFLT
jgi:hypothetical protein